MLKTAVLTAMAATLLGEKAFAAEAPKFDRKIERAAIERVASKMGGLRKTLELDVKAAVADVAAMPLNLDFAPTSTILIQPNEPRFPMPVRIANFTVIAGEYDR